MRPRSLRKTIMGFVCCSIDRQFQDVLLLSISFMLLFTSFGTLSGVEETILDSIHQEDKSFTGNGYTSQSIIYTFFAASNFFAPFCVAYLGTKWTLVSGALFYVAFVVSFFIPSTLLLYSVSAALGFGAAIIWTAQGNYLTLSSNSSNMSRNAGVFWALFQMSMFIGNSYVFWVFAGKKQVDADSRQSVFIALTTLACIGTAFLCFLRAPGSRSPSERGPEDEEQLVATAPLLPPPVSPINALTSSFRLLRQPNLLILILTFLYTGHFISFFSGVYATCVGFTSLLPQAKRLVGLCGILIGVGEVVGGVAFGLLGSFTNKHGRDPVVFLGFLVHTATFYLIFLNLPAVAPFGETNETGFLESPSASIAILCAFLLGFGDACFNTQLYGMLGNLYPGNDSAPAFALFKFTQSAAAAVSFFYSTMLNLHWQLTILQISCILGTGAFFIVEWRNRKSPEPSIHQEPEHHSAADIEDS